MTTTTTGYGARLVARQTFEQAYRRGKWWKLIAKLFQRRVTLHGFDEVRRNVRITNSTDRGIRDIRVEAIYGSVSRTHDYTPTFLPLNQHLIERWSNILNAMEKMESLPPIEVYKVGEHYYIIDGHHRVSVAKWLGIPELSAHVIEIETHCEDRSALMPVKCATSWQAVGC